MGRSLTWIIEKHSTGAATLLIHMLANIATNILVRRTVRGLVPALLSTNVAIILAMLYFDSAAAIVKPPRSNMITGFHIAAKMYKAAASDLRRRWGLSSSLTTRKMTTRKGTRRDVTNSGMACNQLVPSTL